MRPVSPADEAELSALMVMLEQTPEDISGYPVMTSAGLAQAMLANVEASSFCQRVQIDAFDPVLYKMKTGMDFYTLVITSTQPSAYRPAGGSPVLFQEVIAGYREQRAALACLNE